MKLEELTEENLLEILKIYERHCGFEREFSEVMYHQDPSTVLSDLRKNRLGEYRVGSKWEGHSKLFFEINSSTRNITVRFNSNFDPRDRKGPKYVEAEKSGRTFEEEVTRYLNLQK